MPRRVRIGRSTYLIVPAGDVAPRPHSVGEARASLARMLDVAGPAGLARLRDLLEREGDLGLGPTNPDPLEVAARQLVAGRYAFVRIAEELRLLSEPEIRDLIDPLAPLDPDPHSPGTDPDQPSTKPNTPTFDTPLPSVPLPGRSTPSTANTTAAAGNPSELPGAETETTFEVVDKDGRPLLGTFTWVLDGRALSGALDQQPQAARSVETDGETDLKLESLARAAEEREQAHG